MSESEPEEGGKLRYVINCAGCGAEIEIVPEELGDRLSTCPDCGAANPTPIFKLLRGREE